MIRIIQGDVREVLPTLPDESVHCVVTSPPYWGLRDYGVAGQLGMERTLGEHLQVMVDVFREVRRVLRKDGTCWLNYGDCYATSPNGRSAADTKATGNDDRTFRDKPFSTVGPIYNPKAPARWKDGETGNKGNPHSGCGGRIESGGYLKPKDLCMVSNRLAIALQEDGWWVRSEIVWHKPNPMPESVTDRPSSAHEKVWLLTKSDHEKVWLLTKAERYWYDAESVRRPAARPAWMYENPTTPGNTDRNDGGCTQRKRDKQRGHSRRHAGFNDRWDQMKKDEQQSFGANLRNVWTIATSPFPDAHFATFPCELAELCIKAGCPRGGVVLDPFGGSGTVGLVADRLGRNAILIELNPDYCEMARNRIRNDAPMFAQVSS